MAFVGGAGGAGRVVVVDGVGAVVVGGGAVVATRGAGGWVVEDGGGGIVIGMVEVETAPEAAEDGLGIVVGGGAGDPPEDGRCVPVESCGTWVDDGVGPPELTVAAATPLPTAAVAMATDTKRRLRRIGCSSGVASALFRGLHVLRDAVEYRAVWGFVQRRQCRPADTKDQSGIRGVVNIRESSSVEEVDGSPDRPGATPQTSATKA